MLMKIQNTDDTETVLFYMKTVNQDTHLTL